MAEEEKVDDKTLKDVAVVLDEGKLYTPVHERIKYFNEHYPDGGIETQILTMIDSDRKIIKALVTPDWKNNPQRRFTGHSEAFYNAEDDYMRAALEVAETSAIGRALGSMGIGIIGGMASANEIAKNKKAKEVKTKEVKKPDYESIADKDLRGEALAISESINESTKVDELREIKQAIRKSGLSKDIMELVSLDFNNKMRELKRKEKDNA